MRPLKLLIAPDSFKETLSASQVCDIIGNAFIDKFGKDNIEITKMPLSDGGEGIIEVLRKSLINKNIISKYTKVKDVFGNMIKSEYLIIDSKIAILEMASVVGLNLLDDNQKNPMNTTTNGIGELIKNALDNNIRDFIIGIGGTSTNDAGFGMLQELGVQFLDKNDNLIIKSTPKYLANLKSIDVSNMDTRLKECNFTIACDVNNPLCGENGASYVFAPQKGANEDMIKELDSIILNFARVVEKHFNIDIKNTRGVGAGGGIGFSFLAFLNAKLESGINIIMDMSGFSQQLEKTDIIITGEGRTDAQSLNGKVVYGVGKIAKKYNKEVIVISGCLKSGFEKLYDNGISSIFSSVLEIDTLKHTLDNAQNNLYNTSYSVASLISLSRKKSL